MGYSAKLAADAGGLTEYDTARLASDGWMAGPRSANAPIEGFVIRNGQAMPFTLNISNPAPQADDVLPEQIAIAAVLLASILGALWHLWG